MFDRDIDVIDTLSNFCSFATDNANHVEFVAAVVEFGVKTISDSVYQPYEKMGELSNLSMNARKDAQLKYLENCKTFVDRSVRAFLPLTPDGDAWIVHQMPDVLNKYSIETRLSAAPSWQVLPLATTTAVAVAVAVAAHACKLVLLLLLIRLCWRVGD